MKTVREWNEKDLLGLISNAVEESLTLEYKASAALARNDKSTNELSKDVTAFANSDGGVIVYGIKEDKHLPIQIDLGQDPTAGITKEWLENVLISKARPRIEGLVIKPIELVSQLNRRFAFAVEIPRATFRAPHQAADHRYYKRHNFQSLPMEDYEIRDILRRAVDHRRRYAITRALLIETRRIGDAALQRARLARMYVHDVPHRNAVPPNQMSISVLDLLRGSHEDVSVLNVEIADKVLQLVVDVDEYNSAIETQPVNKDGRIGLTQEMEAKLTALITNASTLSEELAAELARQRIELGEMQS
jgi:hypothetical protein